MQVKKKNEGVREIAKQVPQKEHCSQREQLGERPSGRNMPGISIVAHRPLCLKHTWEIRSVGEKRTMAICSGRPQRWMQRLAFSLANAGRAAKGLKVSERIRQVLKSYSGCCAEMRLGSSKGSAIILPFACNAKNIIRWVPLSFGSPHSNVGRKF